MKKPISTLILFLLFLLLLFFDRVSLKNYRSKSYEDEIIGVIDYVRFTERKHPYVTIENKEYFLITFNTFIGDHNIKVEDSIWKKSNSKYLKHFKKNSKGFYYLFETYEIYKP